MGQTCEEEGDTRLVVGEVGRQAGRVSRVSPPLAQSLEWAGQEGELKKGAYGREGVGELLRIYCVHGDLAVPQAA